MLERIHIRVLKGITPQQFTEKVRLFVAEVDGEIGLIGHDTKDKFRDVISAHRRRGPSRSGNRLAKSIKVHQRNLGIIKIVGVGKKNTMNVEAPYWSVVNYGGYLPPPAVGWFGTGNPPDSTLIGKGTEPWYDVKGIGGGASLGGGVWMFPKKPIRPMNFIQTTINLTVNRWRGFWRRQLRSIWNTLPTPPPLTTKIT
ncbi:hypothetical protein LCGC14_2032800 [marine sediment metagenome]|uniref:Uncharacterized protein n=1 Tax=marine sediment metagenome TaxID=412755 RepID=A0A0F9FGQ0_9ZZZZ